MVLGNKGGGREEVRRLCHSQVVMEEPETLQPKYFLSPFRPLAQDHFPPPGTRISHHASGAKLDKWNIGSLTGTMGWDTSKEAMISVPLQPVCLHVCPVLPGVVLGPTTVSA